MTDHSSYFVGYIDQIITGARGVVGKLVPGLDFGPDGRTSPCRLSREDRERSFPNTGRVSWHDLPPEAERQTVWAFRVRESPTFDESRSTHDQMATFGRPERALEVIDLPPLNDPDTVRELLLGDGLRLWYRPAPLVYLCADPAFWVGPVSLIPAPGDDGCWRLDPRWVERPIPVVNRTEHLVGTLTVEAVERHFLAPGARPETLGMIDWASDEVVLKRVLRWVHKRDPAFTTALELSDRLLTHAADTLLAREASAGDRALHADRLRRAMRLVGRLGDGEGLADQVVEDMLRLPRVQREIAKRVEGMAKDAVRRALDAVQAEITAGEARVADLKAQEAALWVDVQTLNAELDAERAKAADERAAFEREREAREIEFERVEKEYVGRIRELAKRPGAILADLTLLHAMLPALGLTAVPPMLALAPANPAPTEATPATSETGEPRLEAASPRAGTQSEAAVALRNGGSPDHAHDETSPAADGARDASTAGRVPATVPAASPGDAGAGNLGQPSATPREVAISAPRVISSAAWKCPGTRAPSPIADLVSARRAIRRAMRSADFSGRTGLALHAAFLSGAVPVVAGPRAFDLLESYAHAVTGGALLWVPISPGTVDVGDLLGRVDARGRFVPAASGLVDALITAEHEQRLLLVILDGVNRAPVDAYLAPLLACYATAWRDQPRRLSICHPVALEPDDPYTPSAATGLAWPRQVLLAATLAAGPATLAPSAEFWAHAVLLEAEGDAGELREGASEEGDTQGLGGPEHPSATTRSAWGEWAFALDEGGVAYTDLAAGAARPFVPCVPDVIGERLYRATLTWVEESRAAALAACVAGRLVPTAVARGIEAALRDTLDAEELWTPAVAARAQLAARVCVDAP